MMLYRTEKKTAPHITFPIDSGIGGLYVSKSLGVQTPPLEDEIKLLRMIQSE